MKNEILYLINTKSCSSRSCACPEDLNNCAEYFPQMGGAHNRFESYDKNTLVYDEDTLVSYISTRCVPRGVEITNRKYWQPLNVSGYADDNIIIISDKNVSGLIIPYTLETVLPTIAEVARKLGAILSFFSTEGGSHWELWQFFGLDTSDWEDTLLWRSIYGANSSSQFVGWFETLEELYQSSISGIEGKYAIVGDLLKDVIIYKGTSDGWVPMEINIYLKFLNDLTELAEEGTISLTDDQKEAINYLLGCCGDGSGSGSGGGSGSSINWGENGKPFTTFNVKCSTSLNKGFTISYPKSIYFDSSDILTSDKHYISISPLKTLNLDLKFTTGAWVNITNNSEVYSTYNKDSMGYLEIRFDSVPTGLMIKVDNNDPVEFVNGYKVPCDGGNHTITLSKESVTVEVTLKYYSTLDSDIKTKIIEVPLNTIIESPIVDSEYSGHTFSGWALNSSTSIDPNNSFCVLGRSNVTPNYFDFSRPITLNVTLYAWYSIKVTFIWTDNNGNNAATRNVPYNTSIDNLPSVGRYTGYEFKGWMFENNIVSGIIGPITKPITITGVFNEITGGGEPSIEYNYFTVHNNTGLESVLVTVNGVQKRIYVAETFNLEPDSIQISIDEDPPTSGLFRLSYWTINDVLTDNATVSPGEINIGLITKYIFEVKFLLGCNDISSVSMTIGDVTQDAKVNPLFVTDDSLETIVINETAPEGYTWEISGEKKSTLFRSYGIVAVDLVKIHPENSANLHLYIVNGLESDVTVKVVYFPTDSNLSSSFHTEEITRTLSPDPIFSTLSPIELRRYALSGLGEFVVDICVDNSVLPYIGEGWNFFVLVTSGLEHSIVYSTPAFTDTWYVSVDKVEQLTPDVGDYLYIVTGDDSAHTAFYVTVGGVKKLIYPDTPTTFNISSSETTLTIDSKPGYVSEHIVPIWTINGTIGDSAIVKPGNISISSVLKFLYRLGLSTIASKYTKKSLSFKIDGQPMNLRDKSTYILPYSYTKFDENVVYVTDKDTVSFEITEPAPAGYYWNIDGVTMFNLSTIYVDLLPLTPEEPNYNSDTVYIVNGLEETILIRYTYYPKDSDKLTNPTSNSVVLEINPAWGYGGSGTGFASLTAEEQRLAATAVAGGLNVCPLIGEVCLALSLPPLYTDSIGRTFVYRIDILSGQDCYVDYRGSHDWNPRIMKPL